MLIAAAVVFRSGQPEPASSRAPVTVDRVDTAQAVPSPELEPGSSSARVAPAAASALARPFADEAALMARLRELGQSDPALALEIAREGNQRFSGSADAPERFHTLIKALENLGRFDEAREEARRMVDTYPGTAWTLDVERHVLSQPGRHPSQRGYYGE